MRFETAGPDVRIGAAGTENAAAAHHKSAHSLIEEGEPVPSIHMKLLLYCRQLL